MFPELSPCVNGQESEYPFSVNANESEYSKIGEAGNIYQSGKNLLWCKPSLSCFKHDVYVLLFNLEKLKVPFLH